MEITSRIERTNSLQVSGTRIRLTVSRAFGLSILLLLVLGSSHWTHARFFDELLFLAGVLLVVAGACGRLWCFAYIAGRKKKVLTTVGPYSMCRHPLYFFSMVTGIGLGLCTKTVTAALLFVIAFAVYYPYVIRTEEQFLSANFPEYEDYKKQVPLFFPSRSHFNDGDVGVNACDFRREILGVGGFLAAIGLLEFLACLHHAEVLPTYFLIP
jgi:protein-S-isoprenylcysteine O-methyltransferase Ste14